MEPYRFELTHDADGRIVGKTETLPHTTLEWAYVYDGKGRLTEATLDGRRVCACWYDRQGRRLEDHFPFRTDHTYSRYTYRMDNRLQSAGNNTYTHDENGFRLLWNCAGQYTRYDYSTDYRLLCAEAEGRGRVFEFAHDADGQREAKYLNGQLVEAYRWLDFVRLAGYFDGEHAYEFAYEEDMRTPYAMRRDDGVVAYLFYDQVGSLRVVADAEGNVVKDVLYDPFGGIIEDSNPGLRIPIGFAGGLHDRDLGFVRFGWRDYDAFTGRWTAPDPIGDAGGDDDWYGYCLDDPVNMHDPLGLMGGWAGKPDEDAPYLADTRQWQANPGACEKCQALDGNYYAPGSEPQAPHPNCKCKMVDCFYTPEFTEWEEVSRDDPHYTYTSPVIFPFQLNVVRIHRDKIIIVHQKRKRTSWKTCGERKDKIATITQVRQKELKWTLPSSAVRSGHSSTFSTNNPFVPGDTRYGKIIQSH